MLNVKFACKVCDRWTDRQTDEQKAVQWKNNMSMIFRCGRIITFWTLFFWLKVLTSQFLVITQTKMKTPWSKIDDEINSSPNDNISDWFKLKQEDHDGPRVSHPSLLDC